MATSSTRHPSRGYVRFVLSRAARLHNAGKPHAAWEMINAAGLAEHYPIFLRAGLRSARARFESRMAG